MVGLVLVSLNCLKTSSTTVRLRQIQSENSIFCVQVIIVCGKRYSRIISIIDNPDKTALYRNHSSSRVDIIISSCTSLLGMNCDRMSISGADHDRYNWRREQ